MGEGDWPAEGWRPGPELYAEAVACLVPPQAVDAFARWRRGELTLTQLGEEVAGLQPGAPNPMLPIVGPMFDSTTLERWRELEEGWRAAFQVGAVLDVTLPFGWKMLRLRIDGVSEESGTRMYRCTAIEGVFGHEGQGDEEGAGEVGVGDEQAGADADGGAEEGGGGSCEGGSGAVGVVGDEEEERQVAADDRPCPECTCVGFHTGDCSRVGA